MSTSRVAIFLAWFLGSLLVIFAGMNLSPQRLALQENQPFIMQDKNASIPSEPNSGLCQVSSKYPAAILRWCNQITRYANAKDLPADLVAAVMLVESGGDPLAFSRSGAVGLLQVMPSDGPAREFQCSAGPCFASRPSIVELEDPDFNLDYGTSLLASLNGEHEDIREALLHYGPIEVGYDYADTVLAVWRKYQ